MIISKNEKDDPMKCPFDPSPLLGVPLGMFHCPACGEMVIAGIPHPDWNKLDEYLAADESFDSFNQEELERDE